MLTIFKWYFNNYQDKSYINFKESYHLTVGGTKLETNYINVNTVYCAVLFFIKQNYKPLNGRDDWAINGWWIDLT